MFSGRAMMRPLVRGRGLVVSSGAGRAMSTSSGDNESLVDKIKNFWTFFPGSPDYVQYAKKSDIDGVKGFRYPAPAERGEKVNVPEDDGGDPYNIQYYTRDTARNQTPAMIGKTPAAIAALNLDEKPQRHDGSKGNNNPAVLRYDPTGTRSAMSTTWDAMEAELAKNRPTHLPEPWWFKAGINDYEEYSAPRGLPPRPGKPMRFGGQRATGNW